MTIPCIVWTDQWGRRPSLLIGSIVMRFWLYVVGGLLMQYGEPNPVRNQPYTWILVDHPAATLHPEPCCYLFIGALAQLLGPVESPSLRQCTTGTEHLSARRMLALGLDGARLLGPGDPSYNEYACLLLLSRRYDGVSARIPRT
ncbi:hypothetical protein V1508DRAFT_427392 [Lipomyces doorenjongii]|uniref:uncharacterized protein n=1 Tax=Lipomyces doorenjongii TaxID=383834 RepID=UPI0034CE526A